MVLGRTVRRRDCAAPPRDDLGYVDDWDDGIRAFLGPLAA
jgi:hypothetical protein